MRWIIGGTLGLLGIIFYLAAYAYPPEGHPTVTDWFVVAFTVILAGVGAAQAFIYWKQKAVMDASLAATRESAEASVTAIETTRAIERAIVHVVPQLPPEPAGRKEAPGTTAVWIPYKVGNLGRTHAWIREHRVTSRLVPFPEIPEDLPAPGKVTDLRPESMRPLLGSEEGNAIRLIRRINAEEQGFILDGELAIMLYGEIDYEDAFGTAHTYGFSWVYTRAKQDTSDRSWGTLEENRAASAPWNSEWRVLIGPRSYFERGRVARSGSTALPRSSPSTERR